MKIIDIIREGRGPAFSFEITPPPRGRSVHDVLEIVGSLMPLKPAWFSVTSHPAGAYILEEPDGSFRRRCYKKRPGTLGICGIIQNRFKVDTAAHVLCLGFSREETEDALIELSYLAVENLLVLRGDNPNYEKGFAKEKSFNAYASDLVKQVVNLRQGEFLDDVSDSSPLDFCIGVAGYPEKHYAAANLEIDIQFLKQKVDAGADYILSQMFFDNKPFHEFVARCRGVGIKVPIVPCLKILSSMSQIKTFPRTWHIDLPAPLVAQIMENPENAAEIGTAWAAKQVDDLLRHGHRNIHFYVMDDAHLVKKVIETVS